MNGGIYRPPVGFPRHVDIQFQAIHLDHFRQTIAMYFGSQFLHHVERSGEVLLYPTVHFGVRWVVCFYYLHT